MSFDSAIDLAAHIALSVWMVWMMGMGLKVRAEVRRLNQEVAKMQGGAPWMHIGMQRDRQRRHRFSPRGDV